MKRILISVVLGLLVMFSASAQSAPNWYPKVDDAMATFVNHEGEVEQIGEGSVYDAPLTVTFSANTTETAEYEVLYEWKIVQIKNGKEILLAKRNEEVTTYTFVEGGLDVSYDVALYITYKHLGSGVTGEGEAAPITFSLRGSSMHLYNAFSPNGDGTNDVYRVKTQSLLSFRMKIFNRWGQEIVSGDQSTLDVSYTNADGVVDGFTYYICWDGTYHGRRVEDGVYFILVEAEGSDGIKYARRGDINVLTSLRKEGNQ